MRKLERLKFQQNFSKGDCFTDCVGSKWKLLGRDSNKNVTNEEKSISFAIRFALQFNLKSSHNETALLSIA